MRHDLPAGRARARRSTAHLPYTIGLIDEIETDVRQPESLAGQLNDLLDQFVRIERPPGGV